MENYVIIRKKAYFPTPMLELIFDSILEENIFFYLAIVVEHISVFMFAHEALLRLWARGALCRARPPEKFPGVAL